MDMPFSLWAAAGTDLPACDSRAPGAGADDCRNGSSDPAPEQIGAIGEVAGVDQFVLQAAPQTLDENVVQGTAASIHADEMPRFFSGARKSAEVNCDP